MKNLIKAMPLFIFVIPMLALGFCVIGPAVQPVSADGFLDSIINGINATNTGGMPDSLGDIIRKIINTLMFLLGSVSVLMIIYGGIRYTISGGNTENVVVAKNTILYAVIGLVVAIMAYAIVNFVVQALIS
ncbi:MAG TPA: hypothetical protein PLO25_02215 [Candidatus Saccharibacteria bacterium]|nr:hypothetical protein [Candidatus Saccharibacteria bacterium]